jgi:hypothetical protein
MTSPGSPTAQTSREVLVFEIVSPAAANSSRMHEKEAENRTR